MRAYTLGLYEKAMPGNLTWKEKLEAAKAAGFETMETEFMNTVQKAILPIWECIRIWEI